MSFRAGAGQALWYQAAPGEEVVITGSEPVTGWVKETNDTWRVSVPNSLFGAFNPYRDVIFRTNRGIWLDWMSQGARVTGNLLHSNASTEVDWAKNWDARVSGGEQEMFLEVNHGPILVDNNILLSPYAVNNRSQGVAFAHNLLAGVFRNVEHDKRRLARSREDRTGDHGKPRQCACARPAVHPSRRIAVENRH